MIDGFLDKDVLPNSYTEYGSLYYKYDPARDHWIIANSPIESISHLYRIDAQTLRLDEAFNFVWYDLTGNFEKL